MGSGAKVVADSPFDQQRDEVLHWCTTLSLERLTYSALDVNGTQVRKLGGQTGCDGRLGIPGHRVSLARSAMPR